jgi:hypothetical protein
MINRCWSSQFRELLRTETDAVKYPAVSHLAMNRRDKHSAYWHGYALLAIKWHQVDMLRYRRQLNLGYRNMASLELFAEIEDRRQAIYVDSSLAEYCSVHQKRSLALAPVVFSLTWACALLEFRNDCNASNVFLLLTYLCILCLHSKPATEVKSVTPKKKKHCNCRNSKCLNMYVFSSYKVWKQIITWKYGRLSLNK